MFSMDQWPGYEMERRKILKFLLTQKVRNPVVLTGDIHTNWANELILPPGEKHDAPVAAEFVGTSISSGGNGRREPERLKETLAENPFVKFHNAERGYVTCHLTPEQWRTEFRTVEFVTKPGSSIHTRAAFTLADGDSRLHRS
jgi:alkaline phosphatase D